MTFAWNNRPQVSDFRPVLAAVCLLLSATVASGEQEPGDDVTGEDQIIVIVGAPGNDEFGDQFADWLENWKQVAEISRINIELIGPGYDDPEHEASDRDRLQTKLQEIERESASPLWLVMIGHGTYTRGVAKFNLRGPDLAATELAEWLGGFNRPVVVVNCSAASGPFVNRLSAPGRVVVTATKSGNEQSFARFGKFFSEAIAAPESDLDHDDEVSVQEAFLRASEGVRQFYQSQSRLASEHALIDDNGDGRGTPASMFRGVKAVAIAKDGSPLDGSKAALVTLTPGGRRLQLTQEELLARQELEQQLEQVRAQRSTLDDDAYDAKLEPIMLGLARIYRAAEKREQALSQ